MQELHTKKALNDPHYCDGVISHLEPDLLECDVKRALGNITAHKASVGDGIPGELFKILKVMLLKCCIQYVSKFGKLSSDHRRGKDQFSFQLQRRAMSQNIQTTMQLHSFHMLVALSRWHFW